jgi:hypothetical protein
MTRFYGKSPTLTALAVAIAACLAAPAIADGIDETVENALKFNQKDGKYGQVNFDLNYRYENANAEGKLETGQASTARLRLGYLTPSFAGFQVFTEYEGNEDIGMNNYNDGSGRVKDNHPQYETIADPQRHELNQFWLGYKGFDTDAKIGRQRISLDNQRFIANVPWRQMEQTFDSAMVTNTSLPNTTIKAGYISGRQTVWSTYESMQVPFVNVGYKVAQYGTLTGYGYFIGNNSDAPLRNQESNRTYGTSFAGSAPIPNGFANDLKLLYRAEYAHQQDYYNNPTTYNADYFHFSGGASAFNVSLEGAVEQLGGQGKNKTFDTPLATLHIFNGWADQFLVTPDNGLRDIYGAMNAEVMGVKFTGMYHDFSDDSGKIKYGDEFDLMLTKKFGKHYTLLGKYAYYDDYGQLKGKSDTQKFWLQANVAF